MPSAHKPSAPEGSVVHCVECDQHVILDDFGIFEWATSLQKLYNFWEMYDTSFGDQYLWERYGASIMMFFVFMTKHNGHVVQIDPSGGAPPRSREVLKEGMVTYQKQLRKRRICEGMYKRHYLDDLFVDKLKADLQKHYGLDFGDEELEAHFPRYHDTDLKEI